jgi:hypothetical protein
MYSLLVLFLKPGDKRGEPKKRCRQMRLDNVWLKEESGIELRLQADNFNLKYSGIGAADTGQFFSLPNDRLLPKPAPGMLN